MRDTPYRQGATRQKPVRLMIADDHASVREGLRALFASLDHVEIIDEAPDTTSVLHRVRTHPLDVVVMDLAMPQIGGLATIGLIKTEKPDIAVVVLTRFQDVAFVREALAAGASAYVLKQSSFSQLRLAIDAVMRGEQYLDEKIVRLLEHAPSDSTGMISRREREVLRRTALGQSNKDIAAALRISIRTVEVHKTNGMRKLDFRDRADLVRYASVQGWLAEP